MKKRKLIYLVLVYFLNVSQTLAQLPNAGFENWEAKGGYNNPQDWACANGQLTGNNFPVEKSNDARSGNFAALVKVIEFFPGFGRQGALIYGEFMGLGMTGKPFNERPAFLKGYLKRVVMSGDTMRIQVRLSKWDGSQTQLVAKGELLYFGNQSSYQQFSLTLNYQSNLTPDTVFISLMIGRNFDNLFEPSAGNKDSHFIVDDLSFEGQVSVGQARLENKALQAYPNPLTGTVLHLGNKTEADQILEVYNSQGICYQKQTVAAGRTELELASLPAGVYLLRLGEQTMRLFVP